MRTKVVYSEIIALKFAQFISIISQWDQAVINVGELIRSASEVDIKFDSVVIHFTIEVLPIGARNAGQSSLNVSVGSLYANEAYIYAVQDKLKLEDYSHSDVSF